MKYTPGVNTRVNALSSYNKNPHPTKQDNAQHPVNTVYQRQVLGHTDLNSNLPVSTQKQGVQNSHMENKPSKKTKKQRLNRKEEYDLRNEHYSKNETNTVVKDRKGQSNLKVQMPVSKQTNSMAHKSKNMYSKINRGISPNQPPNKLKAQKEERKNYNNRIGKYQMKEATDVIRRSSSLKVKEKDKMKYNKPSPGTRLNHRGGSFIAPSNSSGKPERARKTKISSSASHIKSSTSKSNGGSNNGCASTNNQSAFGSSYGDKNINVSSKNPGRGNFTENPRIKKQREVGQL